MGKSAAQRAAEYRQRKLAKKDPKAAVEMAKAQPIEMAQTPEQIRAQVQKSKEDAEAKRKKDVAEMEAQLKMALGGTIDSLAVGAHQVFLKKDAPHLGQKRAQRIADLWAPILAPKLVDSKIDHLPVIIAAAGTAGIVLEWVHEATEKKTNAGVSDAS